MVEPEALPGGQVSPAQAGVEGPSTTLAERARGQPRACGGRGGLGKSTLIRRMSAPCTRGYMDLRPTLSSSGPQMRAPGPATKTSPDLAESSPSAAQCPQR